MKTTMSDQEYSKTLDTMVVVCADAVIVNKHKKTFFLAKRNVKPMQGWWIIGGRVLPGEQPHEAIVRKFKAEAGVSLDENRFTFVGFIRHQWKDRKQSPTDHPVDDLSYTFFVELTDEEFIIAKNSLDKKEYQGSLKEFTKEDLKPLHPSLSYLYEQIFPEK